MLTTITTILGLVPMALQINMNFFTQTISVGGITSIWWVQLSTAIIFGLAFSTMLTLVMIPSMLVLPQNVTAVWGAVRSRMTRELSDAVADPQLAGTAEAVADGKRADNDDLPLRRPDAAE